MASAAFPAVVSKVFSVSRTALPTLRVVRGVDITQDPGDVILIGIQGTEQAAGLDWASTGSFEQTMQRFGGPRQETGTVNCLAQAWNGDGDQDAACATAFGYIAAIESAVRTDPTLGLTGYDFIVAEMQGGDVMESQSQGGALAAVAFVITYRIGI
jgi:hypothetical protein